MKAEIICLFAYDIAREANLAAIEGLVRDSVAPFEFGHLKDAPRGFPVYRPVSIQIREQELPTPDGVCHLYPSVKIFSVGALSVKLRVPVECATPGELLAWRTEAFADGTTLEGRSHAVARQFFERIRDGLDAPVGVLPTPEGYTVYCVDTPLRAGGRGDAWLAEHRREVAALLVGEPVPERLSEQEVQETTRQAYAYYQQDLAVIDWDAALVLDEPREFNDTLYVMELANLQLEELRAYDEMLDRTLDKAYDDVERAARPHVFGARQRILKELRGIRMDITKVADELSNITKFFGDWHLARVYLGCSERFHLKDWENSVVQKLRALDGLYTMLQQDSNNRIMLILESAIVAMFVLDLVIIVLLGKA